MRRLVLFVMALLIGMWMVSPAIGASTSDCEPCHAGSIDDEALEGDLCYEF
ncbi:MAG: hypothetical protein SVY15_00620 [Halobacteriota archaeon]|nr:hypothetical protein [Halobacteriota archaeon]